MMLLEEGGEGDVNMGVGRLGGGGSYEDVDNE